MKRIATDRALRTVLMATTVLALAGFMAGVDGLKGPNLKELAIGEATAAQMTR